MDCKYFAQCPGHKSTLMKENVLCWFPVNARLSASFYRTLLIYKCPSVLVLFAPHFSHSSGSSWKRSVFAGSLLFFSDSYQCHHSDKLTYFFYIWLFVFLWRGWGGGGGGGGRGTFLERKRGTFLERRRGTFLERSRGTFLVRRRGTFLERRRGSFFNVVGGTFLDRKRGTFLERK